MKIVTLAEDEIARIYTPTSRKQKVMVNSDMQACIFSLPNHEFIRAAKKNEVIKLTKFRKKMVYLCSLKEIPVIFQSPLIIVENMPMVIKTSLSVKVSNIVMINNRLLKDKICFKTENLEDLLFKAVLPIIPLCTPETSRNHFEQMLTNLRPELKNIVRNRLSEIGLQLTSNPAFSLMKLETPSLIIDGNILLHENSVKKETWEWNKDTRTLSLSNYNGGEIISNGDLTIQASDKTSNHVTGQNYGLSVNGNLSITGGRITVSGKKCGIRVASSLQIKDSTLNVNVTESGVGIISDECEISESKVFAFGSGDNGVGIQTVTGNLQLRDTTLLAESPYVGIYSCGDVSASNSEINTAGGAFGLFSRGICDISKSHLTSQSKEGIGCSSHKLVVDRYSRVVSSGKKKAVASNFEKISSAIRAGCSLDALKQTEFVPESNYVRIGV